MESDIELHTLLSGTMETSKKNRLTGNCRNDVG